MTASGNRYIVVFTDYFTKWPEAFAVPSIEATRIAQLLLDHIIARHSAPRVLLCDRGQNFLSKVVSAVCDLYQIRKVNTSAYHPQTDGLVECFNSSLMKSLSQFTASNQKDWDISLPAVLFGFRIAPSPTTSESPFYLLYGRKPCLPMEVPLKPPGKLTQSVLHYRSQLVENLHLTDQTAAQQIQLSQHNMKEIYDRNAKPYPYQVGDKVWVFTPKIIKGLSRKLMYSWHGPYRLVHKLTPVTFELRTQTNKLLKAPVHVNRMKPFVDPTDRRPEGEPELPPDNQDVPVFLDLQENEIPDDSFEPPKLSAPPPCSSPPNQAPNPPSNATAPPPSNDDDPIYDIEHILKYRTRKGEKQCLVKWKGFTSKHNSWIPVDSLIKKPDSKTLFTIR